MSYVKESVNNVFDKNKLANLEGAPQDALVLVACEMIDQEEWSYIEAEFAIMFGDTGEGKGEWVDRGGYELEELDLKPVAWCEVPNPPDLASF